MTMVIDLGAVRMVRAPLRTSPSAIYTPEGVVRVGERCLASDQPAVLIRIAGNAVTVTVNGQDKPARASDIRPVVGGLIA